MKGVSRKAHCFNLNRIVNIGARGTLPVDHIFRYYGMSGKCCPAGYYDGTDTAIAGLKLLVAEHNSKTAASRQQHNQQQEVQQHPKPTKNERQPACQPTEFTFTPAVSSTRYHSRLFNAKYSIGDFEAYLCYAHCDFRPPIEYARNPDETYRKRRNLEAFIDDDILDDSPEFWIDIPDVDQYTEERVAMTKQRLMEIGVHSVWVYDSLPSARIRRALIYDPFHAFANMAKDLIAILKGDRATEYPSLQMCQYEGRFMDIKVPPPVIKTTFLEKEKQPTLTGTPDKQSPAVLSATTSTSASSTTVTAESSTSVSAPPRMPSVSKYRRNIPWLMSLNDQHRADAFHNCILTPTGSKDKFCSKNPIKIPSYMKGHDKIQYLTTFINFGLHFTDLTKEYKNLVGVISSVVCDLTATVLDPDPSVLSDLSTPLDAKTMFRTHYSLSPVALFNRTKEMLALFEAMLPDSECQFTHHELLDISYALRILGPVRSWWAYCGERFMRTITSLVPMGGVNPMKTVSSYHATEENTKLHSYEEPNNTMLDNKMRYRDNMIKLERLVKGKKKEISNSCWNDWLKGQLCFAAYDFLQILPQEHNVAHNSPFYRLFTVYNSKTLTFCQWLERILSSDDVEGKRFDVQIVEGNPQFLADIDIENVYLMQRCLFREDLEVARQIIAFMPNEIYERGYIKGGYFRCRGEKYSETVEGFVDRVIYGVQNNRIATVNPVNNIREHWEQELQFSSWFKMSPRAGELRNMYGQFNYFFRLHIPGDPILNGLAVGNCVVRNVCSGTQDKELLTKNSIDGTIR